jgi:hypothetical protein
MPIWIERSGSITPARAARPTNEPWSMRLSSSNQEAGVLQYLRRLPLDRRRRFLVIAVVEQAVAVVDDREILEQVEAERILWIDVEDRRGAADRLRAEARARPVGDGRVEGDTPDHGIRPLHVLAEPAAHEGERAGIGRLRLAASGPAGREGTVDGVRWHVVVFLFAHAELASLAGSAGAR